MTMDGIHYMPLTKVATLIEAGDLSPVEVTEALLSRIDERDPKLKSYLTVTADLARQQAKKAEAEIMGGQYRGTMHGIPVAVKDLCYTKGIKTTGGMAIYEDFIPDHDATVVKKLDDAGAVLLGKLHMTEGATLEHHPEFPEPVNPWMDALWTGVSSSGSGIAPAAGLAFATIGSDTGGSIRFPSACNGLTGLKPTWGLISRYGIFDLAATFDHLGPMARSAADVAAMLQALAGHDANDPTSLSAPIPDYMAALNGIYGAQGVRIGYDWDYVNSDTDPVTLSLLKAAIDDLAGIGAKIGAVKFPDPTELFAHSMSATMAEMAVHHEATYPSQANRYGEWIRQGMERGLAATSIDIGKAVISRQKFKGALRTMFDDVDIFVCPVFKHGTPTWEEIRSLNTTGGDAVFRFTTPFNATGSPALTLPCGHSDDGRPVAFQLIGNHGSEALLLKVAHAYQQATSHHLRRPEGY
ncbi:MAG: hypothetical protein ABS75_29010 [Pelagibacterium sp. SCN 63-23]|nr:MAG: hypothetical protein ABS75_29010 [Pelagibacterium sp. SCN 63-23]